MTIDFTKYDNLLIKITKLKDTKFEGNHPNGINEGYVKQGRLNVEKSNEHQCFLLIEGDRFFNTSQVLSLVEHEGYDLATTLNSLYKIEPIFSGLTGTQEKHSVKID